jgi:hypothetical protein
MLPRSGHRPYYLHKFQHLSTCAIPALFTFTDPFSRFYEAEGENKNNNNNNNNNTTTTTTFLNQYYCSQAEHPTYRTHLLSSSPLCALPFFQKIQFFSTFREWHLELPVPHFSMKVDLWRRFRTLNISSTTSILFPRARRGVSRSRAVFDIGGRSDGVFFDDVVDDDEGEMEGEEVR